VNRAGRWKGGNRHWRVDNYAGLAWKTKRAKSSAIMWAETGSGSQAMKRCGVDVLSGFEETRVSGVALRWALEG